MMRLLLLLLGLLAGGAVTVATGQAKPLLLEQPFVRIFGLAESICFGRKNFLLKDAQLYFYSASSQFRIDLPGEGGTIIFFDRKPKHFDLSFEQKDLTDWKYVCTHD